MITRFQISKARYRAKCWFVKECLKKSKTKILRAAKKVCRNHKVILDFKHSLKVLNNIDFIYNDIDRHWAETDGKIILLNTWKEWDDELLMYTLIHEALHGIFLRDGIHYITEKKEHDIMRLIDKKLV